MTSELSIFAARLREHIGFWTEEFALVEARNEPAWAQHADIEFSSLAVMLFALQFKHNPAYRRICEARGVNPNEVSHWAQIPTVPTAAFKEFELTSLSPGQRIQVFHSSGTTEQRPSRQFHSAESLALYEASLGPWLLENVQWPMSYVQLLSLTPPPEQAPHSSLVHMFDFARRQTGAGAEIFVGRVAADGSWALEFDRAFAALRCEKPLLLLGTAFSFVHLLDAMAERNLRLKLPAGSQVLETGGYKGRSRSLPKMELHRMITERLGVPAENILCEYGMSELSSQAYDSASPRSKVQGLMSQRVFRFPPWARARVVSPETGTEVADGETGLLQVFDLANVFSVMAIQTEDLAVRRGAGFELIGRAQLAEPRGCSLMTA